MKINLKRVCSGLRQNKSPVTICTCRGAKQPGCLCTFMSTSCVCDRNSHFTHDRSCVCVCVSTCKKQTLTLTDRQRCTCLCLREDTPVCFLRSLSSWPHPLLSHAWSSSSSSSTVTCVTLSCSITSDHTDYMYSCWESHTSLIYSHVVLI